MGITSNIVSSGPVETDHKHFATEAKQQYAFFTTLVDKEDQKM
jgi:hypothetical protein